MRTIRGRGVVVFTWLFISSKYLIWIAHQRHWKTKNLEASSGADVLSIELFRSYISFFSANLNFLVMITGKIFLQSLFAHPQNRQPLDFFFFFLSFSLVLCLLRKHPIDISGVHDGRSPSSLRIESLIHIAFLDLCNSFLLSTQVICSNWNAFFTSNQYKQNYYHITYEELLFSTSSRISTKAK